MNPAAARRLFWTISFRGSPKKCSCFVASHSRAKRILPTRAADELEAIGRSRPRRSPSLTQLLTPHEQEVVELAITGATTREMATDLFMSPKTVESHLTSSYRKLGVRSKTQLAHVLNRAPARRG